jgi:PIN domain nuclease of toxin-antitoxin system
VNKTLVFDTSALRALYFNETGKKKVQRLIKIGHPLICSVNLCELFTKLLETGFETEEILESFEGLGFDIVDFDFELATFAAELRVNTKHLGLSLGDRACLALASRENARAVTAEKVWATLSEIDIDLIR